MGEKLSLTEARKRYHELGKATSTADEQEQFLDEFLDRKYGSKGSIFSSLISWDAAFILAPSPSGFAVEFYKNRNPSGKCLHLNWQFPKCHRGYAI